MKRQSIRAIGMTTHTRRDIRHLHSVNIIISSDHTIKSMLPVHYHKRIAVIIIEKKSCITVNHFFQLRRLPILNNELELFNDVPHITCWSMYTVLFPRSISFNVKTTELRNTHSCVKENVHHFIILAVTNLVMHKL